MTALTLPRCLSEFIDEHMPALGGAATVRFLRKAPRDMPFRWIIGAVHGIAFFGRVHFRADRCPEPIDPDDAAFVELLFHELAHIEQQRQERLFYPAYFWWTALRGYERNPYEIAADERARDLLHTWVKSRSPPRSA